MMNKRIQGVMMAAVMAGALLVGCSSDTAADTADTASTEETTAETTYSADAYLSGIMASDYVELPDYEEIPVEMNESYYAITDDDVESQIAYELENTAELVEITDRDTVEDGDVVNIDYVGKKDGEAFDGGTASGADLTIGSGRFIDGFEDGCIGMKVGETKTLHLTFPEDYNAEDLAGQDVTFDVTINKIQERKTPEFTDSWVADRAIDDVTTMDEYTAYIREQLEETAQTAYDDAVQENAVQYLVDNATWLQDPPTAMVDRIYDTGIANYQDWASSYGMELDDFLALYGYEPDDFKGQVRDMAATQAKRYICLQAIADAEDLNLTDAEYKTQLAVEAASSGLTDADQYEEIMGEDNIREYLTTTRAEEFVTSNAVVVPVTESATDETESETAAATTEAAEADTEAAGADTEVAAE